MSLSRKLPTLAMLALYLQAAFVLSSVSIIVTDDGTVQIESAAAHLVRWHGTVNRSDVRCAHLESASGPSTPGIPGHSHLKATDSAVGADFARVKSPAHESTTAIPPFRFALLEIAASTDPVRIAGRAPGPKARFAAAEAAFAHLQLLV